MLGISIPMSNETKPGNSLANFKFNTVGREDAAVEVLRPQIDPATRTRNVIFAIIAVAALAAILYFAFQKDGAKIFESPQNNREFAPPAPNVNGL